MKDYEDEAFDELEKAQQRKVATGVTDGSIRGCMTQDEIIEMARQAGMMSEVLQLGRNLELLTDFAKLVAEREREACADIAEKQRYAMNISLTSHPAQNGTAVGILNQIRARGEA